MCLTYAFVDRRMPKTNFLHKETTIMNKRVTRRSAMLISLLLAVLFVFTACTGNGGNTVTTTTAGTTEAPATGTQKTETTVIAEKGKATDFSFVYTMHGDKSPEADKVAAAYKEKLGVEFAVKADTEEAGGNEIVFNSTVREDCKALIDSIVGGYYAIRAVKSEGRTTILVAFKGDLAAEAAVEALIGLIDENTGKAEITDDFNESKAVVTMNENKDKGVIDIYLIAGQSNAAGSSTKGNLKGVFKNVWFTGEVDRNRRTGSASLAYVSDKGVRFSKTVKAGLGVSTNHIGPEYGMAEVLNDYYSDNPVLIFKSAAGGTALQNTTTGLSDTFGNWYPRSLWNGKEVDPENSPMGVQYYNFVKNFKAVYEKLVADGYTPKVRGMVWMQGEDDLGAHGTYKRLIKTFITDMREDIASITGDEEALEMPFIIGKIATTFAQYNNPNVPAFNKMQDEVAASMTNVYTIETSDLIIVDKDGKVLGTDQWHFSTKDAETLGIRFAEKLLEHYTAKSE